MKQQIDTLIEGLTAMINDNEKQAATDQYAAGCVSTAIMVRAMLKSIVKKEDDERQAH